MRIIINLYYISNFKSGPVFGGQVKPRSPWENGYIESFNGKMRDELLNLEMFDTLLEVKILIERWRHEYNHIRPHSSLNYCPPAPEAYEYKEDTFLLTNQLTIN